MQRTDYYMPTTDRGRDRRRDAYFYAAGIDDVTGSYTADEFAKFAAREADAYANEEVVSLDSIQTQYQRFTDR